MDALPTPTPPPIEVRADRIDGALDLSDVTLEGNVRVTAGRSRIRAPRLHLRTRADGDLDVDGPATLSPCGCDDPPIALGVDRATIDPDGGAVLRGVRLLAFGHTVFALPWLALRSETQLGLLPPTLAWRGVDGLLVGAGVHVPLWQGASADVLPAAYLRGGAEVVGNVHTTSSTLHARWDHVGTDLAAVEARGAVPSRDGAVVWDVDTIRGDRARRGTIDLDAAARVNDRAAATFWLAPLSVGAGMRAVAPRGDAPAAFGPRLVTGGSASAGPAVLAFSADATTLARGDGDAWHVARADVDATAATFVGPLRAGVDARATVAGLVGPIASSADAGGTLRAGASLPLARRYGDVVHILEPGLAAPVAVAHRGTGLQDGLAGPLAPLSGVAAAPGVSLSSRLGRPSGDAALIELGAGALVDGETRAIGRTAAAADTRFLRMRTEAAALRAGGIVTGTLSVGAARGLRALGGVEGRAGVDPVAARALVPSALGPSSSWLAAEGWSARTEIVVPIGGLTATAAALWDLGAGSRLAERGELAYAHPCGCLAVSLLLAHRVGRQGPDAALGLSLFP